MNIEKFGLTTTQTEILYNLELYKTLNDIQTTSSPFSNDIKSLKQNWLGRWKGYISRGFPSFLQIEGAKINWYTKRELIRKIEENGPHDIWFRLVLLEVMLFEPYFPLAIEKDKKGNDVPSKEYSRLKNSYDTEIGDDFIDSFFTGDYYKKGYIKRLRKRYRKVVFEMKEVLGGVLMGGAIAAVIAIIAVATAGSFAPAIAIALVGSNFAGLSGAALTSACLAYLGGGAIAVGGAGMAGGTAVIVGGGAALGIAAGLGVGSAVGVAGTLGKQNTILQSAKLLVAVREIFLNDEHDVEYSNTIYEQYVQNIMDIEKTTVELKLMADAASGKEKKELQGKIKENQKTVEAMKNARKNLRKSISSFRGGLVE